MLKAEFPLLRVSARFRAEAEACEREVDLVLNTAMK